MSGLVFGQAQLCRTCGGAGRRTLDRGRVSLETARQLRGEGPIEIDGKLINDPTPAQLEAIRADAIDRTKPCTACGGRGIFSA